MKQYSFYSVDLLIDGIPIEGFSDSNSIITVTRDAPQHGKVMDARGKMAVVTSADKSGTCVFDLLQTSDSNAVLQALALATHDLGTSGSADVFPPVQMLLNDKMGNTVATGVNGIIVQQPAVVRGTGLSTVTWAIQFEQVWFVRGTYQDVGV
jgi:hypothetical protein